MSASERPAFGKGVRLRQEADGTAMLLVPEGALVLNTAAAAVLELVDGTRTVADIVDELVARFEVTPERARADVAALFERLAERRMLMLK